MILMQGQNLGGAMVQQHIKEPISMLLQHLMVTNKSYLSERTHILPNSSSCINLIFTNHHNLVVDHGGHPSLHPGCHYQIIHCKLKRKIEYPPSYQFSF